MLLVYTPKITPRISYIFKHICIRLLGIEVNFTSAIEEFISQPTFKLSYAKQPLGNELFIQSHGLLDQQGFDSEDVNVKPWGKTYCFFSSGSKSALPFDIFSASFYLLSRYEEYLPHVKDSSGRFMAQESLAYKKGFLQQPVVDIWTYNFKKVLENAFPELHFPAKNFDIHTLIEATQPYAFAQKGFLRTSVGFMQDLVRFKFKNIFQRSQVLLGLRRDPFDTFKWIINRSKRNAQKLSIFFLLGESVNFEESINTHRQKFVLLIKFISDYKEAGLLFSNDALADYELLKKEKLRMEEITNRALKSSINARFLVNLPEIYRSLVELEVKNDYTMVYRDVVGFRAGTCTPFLFYDLDFEVKTPLTIHPVALTTFAFNKKYEEEIVKTIASVMSEVESVNGTFTMLFSNQDFYQNERNVLWRKIFSEKLQIETE